MSAGNMQTGRPTLRFGIFEADLDHRELRRRGALVRLHQHPFQFLCALLEHPGRVVTREELRARIWPTEEFDDFEGDLKAALFNVREVLGDSATHPQFVETVPACGYRFVAPVEQAGRAMASTERGMLPAEPPVAVGERPPWPVRAVSRCVSLRVSGLLLAGALATIWLFSDFGRRAIVETGANRAVSRNSTVVGASGVVQHGTLARRAAN